jgi:hypothetical protein
MFYKKLKTPKKKCLSTLKDAISELISQKETQRIQNSLNTSKSEMFSLLNLKCLTLFHKKLKN